uniref:Wal1 protein n=1 Tax=Eremothecium gossypii TaxID=33169 RepID=Q8J1Y5_EREGO|nr:Wal1 protein [Eremothecium gossypii]
MGLLTAEDKEKIKRAIPKASNKIIDVAVARLYIAYPNPKEWRYSGLSGAIALVDDIVGNTFFLKLVDIHGHRGVLWDQELYVGFEYNQDRTFFHSFEMEDCYAGLLFEDLGEAAHFLKRVQRREKYASKKTLANKNAIALAKKLKAESDGQAVHGPRGEPVIADQRRRYSYNAATDLEDVPATKKKAPPPPPPIIAQSTGPAPVRKLPPPSAVSRSSTSEQESSSDSSDSDSPEPPSRTGPKYKLPPPSKEFVSIIGPPAGAPLEPTPAPSQAASALPVPLPPRRHTPEPSPPDTGFSQQNSTLSSNGQTHRPLPIPPRPMVQPPTGPAMQLPPVTGHETSAVLASNAPQRPAQPLPQVNAAPSRSGSVRQLPPPPQQFSPTPGTSSPYGQQQQYPQYEHFSASHEQPSPVHLRVDTARPLPSHPSQIQQMASPHSPMQYMSPPPPPARQMTPSPTQQHGAPPPPPPPRRGPAPPPPRKRAGPVTSHATGPSNMSLPMAHQPLTASKTGGRPGPPVPPRRSTGPPPPPRTHRPAEVETAAAVSYHPPTTFTTSSQHNVMPAPGPALQQPQGYMPPPPPQPPQAQPALPPRTQNPVSPSQPYASPAAQVAAPPPPPPPPMPMATSIPPAPQMGAATIPPPAAEATGDTGRDALLASIRSAGGVQALRKVDKSQLDKPSVLLQEAHGKAPASTSQAMTPAATGGNSLADALAAALDKRKNRVAQHDDDDNADDW